MRNKIFLPEETMAAYEAAKITNRRIADEFVDVDFINE